MSMSEFKIMQNEFLVLTKTQFFCVKSFIVRDILLAPSWFYF